MLKPKALFKAKPKNLPRSQRLVVEYLISKPDEAVFLSAAQMGARIGVSDATVVRTSQALGYNGINQLRRQLRKIILKGSDTVSRMEETAEGIADTRDLVTMVMKKDLDHLRKATNAISREAVIRAAEELARSSEIAVIGLRSAHSPALFLTSALRYLGRRVKVLTPGIGYIWSDARALGPSTVLVAFSFHRYTSLTIEVAKEARQAGAKVIAVTDSELSPLAEHADHILTASCRIGSFMESFVAPMSLLNALVTALGYIDGKHSLDHLEKLERTWEEKGVYHRDSFRSERSESK